MSLSGDKGVAQFKKSVKMGHPSMKGRMAFYWKGNREQQGGLRHGRSGRGTPTGVAGSPDRPDLDPPHWRFWFMLWQCRWIQFFLQSFQTVVNDECLLGLLKTVLLFKAFKHGCVQKLIGIKKMRHWFTAVIKIRRSSLKLENLCHTTWQYCIKWVQNGCIVNIF